jgi:hypothetical protein
MFANLVRLVADGKSFPGVVKRPSGTVPEQHGLVDKRLWLQDYYVCSGTIIGTTSVKRAACAFDSAALSER